MKVIKITDIAGIKVGHAQNKSAATGCTVIICEDGAISGVDVRGGAPGTRETDLLNPLNLVEKIHAIILAGGSAFGLDCASGVMEYLEEHGIGFDVGITKVPIVCGAVLFDLMIGDHKIRPDRAMGYKACQNSTRKKCFEGNVGAGTGATVGKILGIERAMKGGLGIYGLCIDDLKVAAIVAVNCLGDIIDPYNNEIIAGLLSEDKKNIISTENIILNKYYDKKCQFVGNTTIGVVVTNAKLNKSQANKLASISHNGYARTINPTHTMIDGDTIFTMATNNIKADFDSVGILSVKVVEQAILRAVKKAKDLHGYKSYSTIKSLFKT
ncbi:MAG: P1 family peptidase [Candidatus Aminicenantes bacterium]|nr:P1 family peptidase [Candidatus Aminicenantes bacterium]